MTTTSKKTEKKTSTKEVKTTPSLQPTIEMIDFRLIAESPLNPRKHFNDVELKELAENITQQGLLQPITIRPSKILKGKQYEIVCGTRRYRACVLAGMEAIPAIVREMTDEQAFDAMITENLQRKDVEPMDEARAFLELNKRGTSIDELAARFGKSVTFILLRIKLNDLIPEFVEMLEKKELQLSHAFELCKLDSEEQKKTVRERYETNQSWNSWKNITVSQLRKNLSEKFMNLENAKFDKTECLKCPHNCSVSLLFAEFQENSCMNRKCFDGKTFDFEVQNAINMINAGNIFASPAKKNNDPIVLKLKELGHEPLNFEEYNWEWPADDDELDPEDYETEEEYQEDLKERQEEIAEDKEKIESGEYTPAYVVGYWGDGKRMFLTKKKDYSGKTIENNEIEGLKQKDKRNKEIQNENTIDGLKKFLENTSYHDNKESLSNEEEIAMYTAMFICSDYVYRNKVLKQGLKEEKIIEIIQKMNEEDKILIIRNFIKTISTYDITYNTMRKTLLKFVSNSVYPSDAKSIIDKNEAIYLKRKSNIDNKIKALKEAESDSN